MCSLFKSQASTVKNWNVLTYTQVVALFRAGGVTCEIKSRDPYYWFTDESTTIQILTEAHAGMPAYESITATKPGVDCDKFAHHACDVAYLKKINGWFEVWGETTDGGHGWNVLIVQTTDDNGNPIVMAFEAEPQEADIWPIGTNPKYKIKTVYRAD